MLPGNAAHGTTPAVPKPIRIIPDQPDNNASAAVVAFHNRKSVDIGFALDIIASLKEDVLNSIGETNVMRLRDPVHDTRELTQLQIVTASSQR